MASETGTQEYCKVLIDQTEDKGIILTFVGRLDSRSCDKIWIKCAGVVRKYKPKELTLETDGISYCDGVGIGLLIWLRRWQEKRGQLFSLVGLREEFVKLMDIQQPLEVSEVKKQRPIVKMILSTGKMTCDFMKDIYEQISFIGEMVVALVFAIFNPSKVRWKECFYIAEKAGVNSFGIVSTIGFLLGLILAFQSTIPLKRFGAEIFVADLVAISLLRELGPLITAILLAGRSGSSFAAELGTMKVNEEINALVTLGLNPVRFLVISRVFAGIFITPLLVIFANLFGLIGAGIVMLSLGYPLSTYLQQIQGAVTGGDLLGGLFKAVIFGFTVSSIGCFRGLQTGTGAQAVGASTTKAVVSAIVWIILIDGFFSILFYSLGF